MNELPASIVVAIRDYIEAQVQPQVERRMKEITHLGAYPSVDNDGTGREIQPLGAGDAIIVTHRNGYFSWDLFRSGEFKVGASGIHAEFLMMEHFREMKGSPLEFGCITRSEP